MAFILKRFRIQILFLLIFLVGLFLRFWMLSSYPINLTIDEVAIGYNAYSILKTGKDEWGEALPLAFRSVGDFKPPVNVYLTVPSILIFGLTEFAVRVPTALLGTLTIPTFILMLRKLNFRWTGALFGGLWLAVLPWHVHFSRGGYEAVTSLFFLILGITLFLTWVKNEKSIYFGGSLISFALSVWSYHSERIFVPLLFLFLIFVFRKRPKRLFIHFAILLLFALPFLQLSVFTEAIKVRGASTSIFRETSLLTVLHKGNYGGFLDQVFDNDIYLVLRHWLGKYLNYFDLRFWFWKGLFTPGGYPDLGLLYAIDLPLFSSGVYFLVKAKDKVLQKFSLFWFLVGPLAASIAMNEQHGLRALVWLPFFGIVIAYGFERLLPKINRKIIFVYFLGLIASLFYFHDIYTIHFPRINSEYWQYGYKEIAQYVCANRKNYDKIVITPTFGSDGPLITGIPYAYILFYCPYDPAYFLATRRDESKSIDNIDYRRPDFNDLKVKNTLLVASPWDIEKDKIDERNIIKKIYFLNGKLGFIFIKT